MDDIDAARERARHLVEASRQRYDEASNRTSALAQHRQGLQSRVAQLQSGETALAQSDQAELPEDAVRGTVNRHTQPAARTTGGTDAIKLQAIRGAELTMARKKQELAEQHMAQQLEARALNERRLELERKSRALTEQRAELRRRQAAQRRSAPSRTADGAAEVPEEGDLDGGAEMGADGPAREVDDDELDDVDDAEPITAAERRERYRVSLADQEVKLRARMADFAASHGRQQQNDGRAARGYAGELGPQSYRNDQLGTYKAARILADQLVGEVPDGASGTGRGPPTSPDER